MTEIIIGDRKIGLGYRPFVIAEIGINHEGNVDKAIKMVKDAHEVGAECVKFQCHIIEDEMTYHAKRTIPGNAKESIYDIMNRCTLNEDETKHLKDLVEQLGMIYLSTPFSRAAANRLEDLGIAAYKIGSGECNNYPLIKHIAGFKKPIILSTGMNNIESITPSVEILRDANVEFALLHCTSIYPTPYKKVRLGALNELREAFPEAVLGLSDHSLGNYACFGAVSLGASILEKHYTSNKRWDGPDIPISIDPAELKELIHGSSVIHESLGGNKIILKEEQPTIDFAYASVVSIKDIQAGEKFTEDNIWVKRPGTGDILAEQFDSILGKVCRCNVPKDSQILKSWVVM